MPELPEVEITRRGLLPDIAGAIITNVVIRFPRLRHEIPPHLAQTLTGKRITAIHRRGKYLLFACSNADTNRQHNVEIQGYVLLHLGMSGSLRLVAPNTPVAKHDHVDFVFANTILRFRDPRRFGVLDWIDGSVPIHPLLNRLGLEPLESTFNGEVLYEITRRRLAPIKQVLMDAHSIVGIGNIYAAESLFRARIAPQRPANQLSLAECKVLAGHIVATLNDALAAGGSSLKDFVHSDGSSGYFQMSYAVYGRAGRPCPVCATPITQMTMAGRSSCYCPQCQQ